MFDDVPTRPLVIADPVTHSMGTSLPRYVASRVHEFVDEKEYRRIIVLGSYDRTQVASRKEKTDKLENWQRPTVDFSGSDLRVHCFPGRSYVFHYASLIATHLALTGRDPNIVSMELPSRGVCQDEILRLGFSQIQPADVLIVASGNEKLSPPRVLWTDSGAFLTRSERMGSRTVTWLAVKHSFWGDIAFHLGSAVARSGFPLILFIGKLGSLVAEHLPNVTLATGHSSLLRGENLTWANVFETSAATTNVSVGKHVTLPSVLQETTSWVDAHRKHFHFVDPEIGNFAQGVLEAGARFSYLHTVSDNVAQTYAHDLSNEREQAVQGYRLRAYSKIATILREAVIRGSAV